MKSWQLSPLDVLWMMRSLPQQSSQVCNCVRTHQCYHKHHFKYKQLSEHKEAVPKPLTCEKLKKTTFQPDHQSMLVATCGIRPKLHSITVDKLKANEWISCSVTKLQLSGLVTFPYQAIMTPRIIADVLGLITMVDTTRKQSMKDKTFLTKPCM